jgi:DNA polymerase III subunit delta'
MTLGGVVGHVRAVARLVRMADEARVPGAVLLAGPSGIGKYTLARAFAARLLCDAVAGGDVCGTCAQCVRLTAGTHPDLHVVAREEERRDVRIEQVRDLVRWLGLQPLMAPRKVALVDDAHCLSVPAQNALLKTLEEPPGASVIVLVAAAAGLLLPTIRSRCQIVRLEPLATDEVATVLVARGVEPGEARALAAIADGSPGRALTLTDGESRAQLLGALARLPALPAHELSDVAQKVARTRVEDALDAAVAWYRGLLKTTLLGDPPPAGDVAAASLPPALRLRQLEAVCDTLGALERNANRTLALETLLLRLREIERSAPGADDA